MRLSHFIRRHPVALLGLFAIAFVVWLWRDSLPIDHPRPDPRNMQAVWVETPPPPPRLIPFPPVFEKPKPCPHETAQVLAKLKPGMTRAEVEELVGTPAPDDIFPATIFDGRVTYQTAYEADLGPLPTVRPVTPHRPHSKESRPALRERTLVTLEFDATKPGHPLLGIHYPDPLF